jgi:hypothetical protein
MTKAVRTTLSLVVSLVLFGTGTLAHAGGNNIDKDQNKNKEHHSRISKLAFWRHHRDSDKSPKTVQAKQAQPTPAQVKPVQTKPVTTVAAGKKDQNREQHVSNMSKPYVKKAPAANKTKPRQKAQDPKTVSLKQ